MHPPSNEDNRPLSTSAYGGTQPLSQPTPSSDYVPLTPSTAYSQLPPPAPYSPPPSPARRSQSTQQAKPISTEQEKDIALKTITEANPVGASILVLNDLYYKSVLQQAQRSFIWALCAAIVGLLFFLAAIAFLLLQKPQNTSYISVICGALVEAISALNFYLYGRASQQLTAFHLPLERTQRFILANNICETLQDSKEEVRAKIVMALVDAPTIPIDEKEDVADKRGR